MISKKIKLFFIYKYFGWFLGLGRGSRVEGRGLRMGYADAEKLGFFFADFEDIPLDLNFIVLITL